jgi:hypothetical protein
VAVRGWGLDPGRQYVLVFTDMKPQASGLFANMTAQIPGNLTGVLPPWGYKSAVTTVSLYRAGDPPTLVVASGGAAVLFQFNTEALFSLSAAALPAAGCGGYCWPTALTVRGVGFLFGGAALYQCRLVPGNGSDAGAADIPSFQAVAEDAGTIACWFGGGGDAAVDAGPRYESGNYTLRVLNLNRTAGAQDLAWRAGASAAVLLREAWLDTDCSTTRPCQGYAAGGMDGLELFTVRGFGLLRLGAYECAFGAAAPSGGAAAVRIAAYWQDEYSLICEVPEWGLEEG